MIVVDSSVWIANLRRQPIPAVTRLREPHIAQDALVGDIVLAEVLQGARDEGHASRLEAALRQFPVVEMVGGNMAVLAARHYRHLRAAGFTVGKLADLLIATFCIANGHSLLHCDRDYEPLRLVCGLRCVA